MGGRWLFLLLAVFLGGCQAAGMMALSTANGIAAIGPVKVGRDVAYGPHARQKLDVWVPRYQKDDGPRPVVVFFHGGDWSEGYPGKEAFTFVADSLTDKGFVAVVVSYRRYPEVRFPAFVEDAAAAVVWAHEHAAEFGGDPDKLFVMGHSAGAHLAAMVTLDEEYLLRAGGEPGWIAGMIGMAGPYSFLPMPEDPLLQDLFGPPSRYELSQAVNYVDRDEPPMLLLAGGKDLRVPRECMDRLETRARAAGARVTTRVYTHLDHIMLLGSMAFPVRVLDYGVSHDVAAFVREVSKEPRPRNGPLPGEPGTIPVMAGSEAASPSPVAPPGPG